MLSANGRYRRGLCAKLFGLRESPPTGAVWFHGVSVGEIHLLRQVVAAFRKRYPDLPCVISTTTDTGFDEARKCFPDLFVFPLPFDFSWAVRRTLRPHPPEADRAGRGGIVAEFPDGGKTTRRSGRRHQRPHESRAA